MTDGEKKTVGRPRKYSGKRPTWTIRLEEKYGEEVKAKAAERGCSISELCEQQIVWSFRAERIIDSLELKLESAMTELADCRLAFSSANMLKEQAEKDLAKSEERAAAILGQMDHAVMRSIELEDSRNSLIQRVDELVELLALAKGIRKKVAS